jgi:catechol 2,3-dioxygenase-like lactoylglutathione lyase family enzyme
MVEINGVAHVILSVSDWPACRRFYEQLLPFLGMQRTFDGEQMMYFVGGRTAIGISKCDPAYAEERFIQTRVGLHHLCLRVRDKAAVDAVHEFLQTIGAHIVHGPEQGRWAPGYYSVLFEDPIGTRLEVNHVPGQGLLAEGVTFNPGTDYR